MGTHFRAGWIAAACWLVVASSVWAAADDAAPADSTAPANNAAPANPAPATGTAPVDSTASGHQAAGTTFSISAGKPNLVRFESRAPLETFEGKTREVTGHVTFDPAAIGSWMEVVVEVDLASLDTGIDLRNKHMRENHLETAKYPKTRFKGGKVVKTSGSRLEPGSTVNFQIDGILDLHGKQKPLRAPIEMTYSVVDGTPQLAIKTSFEVNLEDFEIKRPKFLVMQVDVVQHLTVELVAKAAAKAGS